MIILSDSHHRDRRHAKSENQGLHALLSLAVSLVSEIGVAVRDITDRLCTVQIVYRVVKIIIISALPHQDEGPLTGIETTFQNQVGNTTKV